MLGINTTLNTLFDTTTGILYYIDSASLKCKSIHSSDGQVFTLYTFGSPPSNPLFVITNLKEALNNSLTKNITIDYSTLLS